MSNEPSTDTHTSTDEVEHFEDHGDKLDAAVFKVAGVVVLGAIMSILDITVVSVGMETFQRIFQATPAQVAWTMTGYTLALATVIPLTGWAADRFGTKRLYLIAIFLFAAGSALCSTASSLELLVTYRVLQGLGGGMLMPLGMTILTRAAGPERVGRVMAVMGIPMLLGPIFGPILGGVLIDHANWHWIFLINVPIGVLALGYAWFALPKDHVEPSESFDFVGMLLLSPGLALFLYGVSSIPQAANDRSGAHVLGIYWSPSVLWGVLAGTVLIVAFIPWALRKRNVHPLVDLRLFSNRGMTMAVIAMALFAIAFFGASLLFPLYFQSVREMSAEGSGWLLAPQGIGAMITMPIAGMLADKIGPGKVVIPGLALAVAGLAFFTQLDDGTSKLHIIIGLVIMGLGMGSTMMPIFSAALATLTDHSVARGSTLLNITQQVAASIGTALFSVLLTNTFTNKPSIVAAQAMRAAGKDPHKLQAVLQHLHLTPQHARELAGHALGDMALSYAHVFLVGTILLACCLVPALFLPKHKVNVDTTAMMGH